MLERSRALFRVDAAASQRTQGNTVYWILASTASGLLLMGWLLPWFVNAYSAGVGFSPQDALISSPTGVGTFLIYILAVTMVILVLSPIVEPVARRMGRRFGPRVDRVRLIAALLGLALTAIIWFLVKVLAEEPLFGSCSPGTYTDSAVSLTMYGYALAALVYGARRWVVARQTFSRSVSPPSRSGSSCPSCFIRPRTSCSGGRILAIYMLLALGLNVVVGFAGTAATSATQRSSRSGVRLRVLRPPQHNIHLPLGCYIFLSAAAIASMSARCGSTDPPPSWRLPGHRHPGIQRDHSRPAQPTTFSTDRRSKPASAKSTNPATGSSDFSASPRWFYWALLLVSVAVIVLLRNVSTRVGRAWVALREDQVATASTGINATATKLLAFAIGASSVASPGPSTAPS